MKPSVPSVATLALVAAALIAAIAPAQAGGRSAQTNYILRCTGCHGQDGSGSEQAGIPDFRGYVGSFARSDAGRRYLMHVPGVTNASLDTAEIAAVMNYVIATYAGASRDPQAPEFTPAEVDRLRASPVADVVALRREVVAQYVKDGWPVAGYPWP